jgi:hypothetical protein
VKPKRLSRPEALKLVRKCLHAGGAIIPTRHFREELENEKLTLPDALHVIRTGQIISEPEPDIKTGAWKYRIEGKEPDGKWLVIVFCFEEIETVETALLITVWSVRSGR